MGCDDSAKAGSVSFEALTFDVQERRSHTLILSSAQTTEVRRDSDRQNNPPHSILVLDIVPKPFEEEQKGQFDTPETGVERVQLQQRICAGVVPFVVRNWPEEDRVVRK